VHTSAGGGTDLFARFTAELLTREKLVNQPVNVINRAGGGGAIAYTYIKSKRREPHTVMTVATLAMLTNSLRPELGLGLENYTPLAMLAQDPQAVMVPADAPHKSFKDFIEAARCERLPDRSPGSSCSGDLFRCRSTGRAIAQWTSPVQSSPGNGNRQASRTFSDA
jgi:tripartite-type tricarboxylate transporter receptor subunit TctC